MIRLLFILLFFAVLSPCFSQVDTGFNASRQLDEVVVTGTRTERKVGNVAVPVSVINQYSIRQSGSLRLNDILQEQTGILITSGTGSGAVGGGVFGNGVQLQGLSPDHTLLLLDGEPLIGRQGGVMDLSRFAVGNVRKIEMVKGPSSSLYGSEAMGGVINIITEPASGTNFTAGLRSGSFFNTDVYSSCNTTHNKTSAYYFLNHNSSSGYELDKTTPEKTVDPFRNLTAQIKLTFRFNPSSKLVFNSRGFYGLQKSRFAVNSRVVNVTGEGVTKDFLLNPVYSHRFNKQWQTSLRLIASGYSFVQKLDSLSTNKEYYHDSFQQSFYRAENQTDFSWNENNTLTIGEGYTLQTVNTTRYKNEQQQQMWHAFAQHEWKQFKNITVISGLRYDYNTAFKARLSPKLALLYKLNDNIAIRTSFGSGFKAPDFRQLYLNFTNNAAEGYSIYGSNEFSINLLQQQQMLGIIASILPAANSITKLNPEVSNGFNAGVQVQINTALKADINLFRNDVSNLINYIPVATNSNGTSVFSYVNINRAYTQGIESNWQWKKENLVISGGYQFLLTVDKDQLARINKKEIYGRDEVSGPARLMTKKDYSGLLNRSRHMANLRIFYAENNDKWNGSLRFIYRSRFGVTDRDGNGFANMEQEFAPGLLQVNLAATRRVSKLFQLQVGINNLLNSTNAKYLPNIPGINWYAGIHYSFHKNQNSN
jgi:outer membrane receptor for ferrienterochelin and colicins